VLASPWLSIRGRRFASRHSARRLGECAAVRAVPRGRGGVARVDSDWPWGDETTLAEMEPSSSPWRRPVRLRRLSLRPPSPAVTLPRTTLAEGRRRARVIRRRGQLTRQVSAERQTRTVGPCVRLLAYRGLRLGELMGLTWSDVDFHDCALRVRRQRNRHPDGGRLKTTSAERDVVLPPHLSDSLRATVNGSSPEGRRPVPRGSFQSRARQRTSLSRGRSGTPGSIPTA
jgi:integrase